MSEQRSVTTPPEQGEIHFLQLVNILVRHKLFLVKISALAAVISAAVSLALPDVYSATARVLPPQKEGGGGLSALVGQLGGLANLAAGTGLGGGSDLYVGILKSRSVADAVIERLDLSRVYGTTSIDTTRIRLARKVHVQAGKDGIITITAEDGDPKRSALLANAFVDQLARTTVRLNLSKAGTERVFLEKRLDLVKKDLKAAEENLKLFAQDKRVVHVDSQAKAAIEGIARLKAELVSREVQLASLRSYQTEEHADVKLLQTSIRRLQGELGRLAGQAGGGDGIPSLGTVPGVGLEYTRRMRDLKVQEAIFEQLTKQYEMAKLNEAKDSSTLQILDDAVVPAGKTKPKRLFIVGVATCAAFLAALGALFIREFFARMSGQDREICRTIKKNLVSLE